MRSITLINTFAHVERTLFCVCFFRNSMIDNMREIEKCKAHVQDVEVPLEVFEYIDQGRNPQLYTKDCIEKALEKNQQVNGKIDAYKNFKSLLVEELSKHFPKEIDEYQKIKERQLKT